MFQFRLPQPHAAMRRSIGCFGRAAFIESRAMSSMIGL